MDNPDQILESLLEVASTKQTMAEFVKAFELAVEYVGQMKAENAEERAAIDTLIANALSKALEAPTTRLLASNAQEWAKIQQKVSQLRNGHDGRDGSNGINGRDGVDGKNGIDGRDGKDGVDGKDAVYEELQPDQVVDKVNSSNKIIQQDRIEGLTEIKNMAIANSMPVTTSFFNGLRAKNLTITGATARQSGDTVTLTVSGSGGGQVNSVVAGTGISVDSTDPANPIVSVTGGASFAVLLPTAGAVNGTNKVFTFSTAPQVVVVDNGSTMNKTNITPDLTQNWTGTTTITLQVAPTSNIFAF